MMSFPSPAPPTPPTPAARRRISRGLLLALLLASAGAAAEPGRSRAELEQLRQSIDELQQQLAAEGKQEQSLAGELEQLERQLGDLAAQRRAEMSRLQRVKNSKAELEQRRRQLETRHRESRENLSKLARASYLLGRQSGLKLILSQHNPAEISRALAVFRQLSKARNRRIEADEKLRRELAETRAELDHRQRQLDALLDRLARNQAQLDAQRARRERHLGVVRAHMKQGREQMAVFTQRERELERLLARLRRPSPATDTEPATANPAANPQTPAQQPLTLGGFRRYKGSLGAPVSGRITARFGQEKPESGQKWEGLMFEAAEGREVVAIYPGQVVFSDWFRGYGQLMVLDHGDGYMSLYGHNRALRARLGASVEAGQRIAEAGSTGGLRRPGLYFEIRHNGEPRDPLEWCRI